MPPVLSIIDELGHPVEILAMLTRRHVLGGAAALLGSPPLRAHPVASPLKAAILLEADRLTVSVRTGDRGPYRFALDSGGAMNLIENDLARALRLKFIGSATLTVNGKRGSLPCYEAPLTVGDAFRQPVVTLAGVSRFSFGEGVVGSLSAGFLSALPSEIAIDEGRWTIWEDRLPALPGYEQIPGSIGKASRGSTSFIFMPATVNGTPLRLALDTGFPGNVRLNASAAHRVGIHDDGGPWAPTVHDGRIARARKLTLGGVEFDGVLVASTGKNYSDGPYEDGLVGLGLLRALNLASNPDTGDLWVRRNLLPPAIDHYSLAGIWLERSTTGGRVIAVGRLSPGEAAGLKIGDRISGVFETLIDELAGPDGAIRSFRISRNGVERLVQLRLARFL